MKKVPAILSTLLNVRQHPDAWLLTWHPKGVLNDRVAKQILDFIEVEELVANGPFNRYIDLGGITEAHLTAACTFWVADQRRRGYSGLPVKSAFVADWVVAFGIARLYEELMQGSAIEVRVFRTREAAAEWLQVAVEQLLPDF